MKNSKLKSKFGHGLKRRKRRSVGGRTWGMEEDTPVMMVDMVSTVVIPAGENTHTHTHRGKPHIITFMGKPTPS